MIENNKLKAFVRYDGNNNIVPGSLILRLSKPKDGKWEEIPTSLCCRQSSIGGEWFLNTVYEPPIFHGGINLPNHFTHVSGTNPNLVGTGYEMLYINVFSSDDIRKNALIGLQGRSGTLTLSQGSNSVTYSFNPNAFVVQLDGSGNPSMIAYDCVFSSSTPGSISVIIPSLGDFNTTDPIIISIT
jgi:hypothetical protein